MTIHEAAARPAMVDLLRGLDHMQTATSFHHQLEEMTAVKRSIIDPNSDLSTFEQIVPQEPEELKTMVPRGMRCALSSKLGGYGRHNKMSTHSSKIYNVLIEPHGRKNMVKEILRYGDTASPFDVEAGTVLPQVRFDHGVLDAIIDERCARASFRAERVSRFKTHKYVPALVTERLVPCWRSADTQSQATPAWLAQKNLETAVALSKEKNAKSNKVAKKFKGTARRHYNTDVRAANTWVTSIPTVSHAMKRTEKVLVEDFDENDWQISSISEAKELMHPPGLCLDNGGAGPAWDELREKEIAEFRESRSRWLAHDVKPGGKQPSPVAGEIAEIRQNGKPGLKTLQAQYATKREVFQKAPRHSAEQSFQRFCDEKKAKAQALEAEAAAKLAAERKPEGFYGGLLSLGLSKADKQRSTHPDIASGLTSLFRRDEPTSEAPVGAS